MFGFSFWEIGLILIVALIVLGPKRLPALAKTLGKGLRELRRASSDLREAIAEPLEEVRKPLQDMRDDLVETVHNLEREVQQEVHGVEQIAHDHNPYAEHEADRTEEIEIDDHRRQEVEDLYASYAKDDAVDDEAARYEADADDADPSGEEAAKADPSGEEAAKTNAAWDDSAWDDTTWDDVVDAGGGSGTNKTGGASAQTGTEAAANSLEQTRPAKAKDGPGSTER